MAFAQYERKCLCGADAKHARYDAPPNIGRCDACEVTYQRELFEAERKRWWDLALELGADQRFGHGVPHVHDVQAWARNEIRRLKGKNEATSHGCDCGAHKAKTTHADWCSVKA